MSDLTDLEICKRIAEIEGFEFDVKSLFTNGPLGVWPKCGFKEAGMSIASGSYNPLTDDALIKQFIYKYEVTIVWGRNLVMMYRKPNLNPVDTVRFEFTDKSELNKTILLAIIEAHND